MNFDPSLPALLGGVPVRPQGPPEWPHVDEVILTALQRAYLDGSWGKYQGGNVTLLEERLREFHQSAFATTCSSGTIAVELALRGLRIEAGDEVILAGYDYPGNFLCVHALGARPVLVDVAEHNWNLDPDKVAQAIGTSTRAIIVSHLHGGLVPMRQIMDLAAGNNIAVIEDAAQCPGAVVEGKRAGTWGDVGILSFGGSKLLTAGRGGAVLTQNPEIHQRIRLALQRGNVLYPLSELQAAVLLPQLEKLSRRNATRRENVQRLAKSLVDVPGLDLLVNKLQDSEPAYYKLGFRYDAAKFGLSRERLVNAMRAEGIAFDEGFRALHFGRSAKRFRQGSELAFAELAHHGMVILHHPVLLGSDFDLRQIHLALDKIREHVARF